MWQCSGGDPKLKPLMRFTGKSPEILLCDTHRVLYVDIDIHHGDGVEEAFYTTDRVMTVRRVPLQGGGRQGEGH